MDDLEKLTQRGRATALDLVGLKDMLYDKRTEWTEFRAVIQTGSLRDGTLNLAEYVRFLEAQTLWYERRIELVNRRLGEQVVGSGGAAGVRIGCLIRRRFN